jgi:hypothetical protein
VFKNNVIRDTRTGDKRRQTTGIQLEENVGAVTLAGNRVEAARILDDRRKRKP